MNSYKLTQPVATDFNVEKNPLVLVVDDQIENLQLIAQLIEDNGYDVALAEDGHQALEILKIANVDIMLLDVMMPNISGFDVIQKIRSEMTHSDIPVIFLTARNDSESVVRGFSLGGADYITKPYNDIELLSRLKHHILLKQQKEELTELNDAKDKLIGIIGHDLRNPIFGVISVLDDIIYNLKENNNSIRDEEHLYMLELAFKAAKSAENILEDILEWSRVITGKKNIDSTSLKASDIVNHIKDESLPFAEKKDIELKLNIVSDPIFQADQSMVCTALRNILMNAIKFSYRGGIIDLETRLSEKSGFLEIIVRD